MDRIKKHGYGFKDDKTGYDENRPRYRREKGKKKAYDSAYGEGELLWTCLQMFVGVATTFLILLIMLFS